MTSRALAAAAAGPLVRALRRAYAEITAEDIADVAWLACKIAAAGEVFADTYGRPDGDTPTPDTRQLEANRSQEITAKTAQPRIPGRAQRNEILPSFAHSGATAGPAGRAVALPSPKDLAHSRAMVRALYPLRRNVASAQRFVIDEEATAQRFVEQRLLVPVMRPEAERWLNLELVVDVGPSMRPWRRTAREVRQLLQFSGIFRHIQVWGLQTGGTGPEIQPGILRWSAETRRQELPTLPRRQLIIILSDCVSPLWRGGGMTKLLARWSQITPVALWQVLPKRLWARTALAQGTPMRLAPTAAGAANVSLLAKARSGLFGDLPTAAGDGQILMPVVSLDPESLASWAKVVAGSPNASTPGIGWIPTSDNDLDDLDDDLDDLEELELVDAFELTASTEARRLASCLAATPAETFTLPLIRLVRSAIVGSDQRLSEAEVLLNGLFETVPSTSGADDEEHYRFRPRVREALLESLPLSEAARVLQAEEITSYLAHQFGPGYTSNYDLRLILADPAAHPQHLVPEDGPFARLVAEVLSGYGGDYARVIGRRSARSSVPEAPATEPKPAETRARTGLDETTPTVGRSERDRETEETAASVARLRALLIGISHYEENDVCASLQGAVADVEAMEAYLLEQGVPAERIYKLTVSNSAGAPPPEPREAWPTYENMVAAIQRLTAVAEPGEHVLIHYSGHAGRTKPSIIPESKSIDTGLAPPNVGRVGARYLRDVELTYLLQQMVQKGLLVTLIVDAAYSGGLLSGSTTLGIPDSSPVDEASTAPDSLVASRRKLKETWQSFDILSDGRPDGTSTGALVLLAACRSVETSYEIQVDGGFRGLLSHLLLGILAEDGHELSFRQIHNQLLSRIRKYARHQTPVLEGDTSRRFFGGHSREPLNAIEVRQVDLDDGRVLFGAGQAVGLAEGALLQILPTTRDLAEPPRQHVFKVTESGASESWGYPTGRDHRRAALLQPGDQAILIDPGDHLRRRVMMVPPEREHGAAQLWDDSPRHDTAASAAEMLDAVRQELVQRDSGFLQLVEDAGSAPDDPPDLLVTVELQDVGRIRATGPTLWEYKIRHSDSGEITDLPLLPVTNRHAASRVVDSLIHLAKFENVRDLENRDQRSPLNGKLTVELGLLPEDFAPGQDIRPIPFAPQDAIPSRVQTGRWICLTVFNRSYQALEITVLDLQPGWTIEQIHPSNNTETLEGGTALRLPFQIYLPSGFQNRREIFKVFGTAWPTDFRWLQLPTIGTPQRSIPPIREAQSDAFEPQFVERAQNDPKPRGRDTRYASRFWTSSQAEFEVVADGEAVDD